MVLGGVDEKCDDPKDDEEDDEDNGDGDVALDHVGGDPKWAVESRKW